VTFTARLTQQTSWYSSTSYSPWVSSVSTPRGICGGWIALGHFLLQNSRGFPVSTIPPFRLFPLMLRVISNRKRI